ncbi:MAG: SLBB domain-containing protein [Armatimonadota bacterium]|jgi:polysaccharide export outer membrane protein
MRTSTPLSVAAAITGLILLAVTVGHAQAPLAGYTASTGDVLDVTVFGEQQLSGQFRVGPTGTLSMPVVGNVEVGGRTLKEIEDDISTQLQRLIKRPMVTVALDELASQRKVYTTGEVQQVGAMILPFGATVADAVTAAGPNELADLRSVRLTRTGGPTITVDLSGLRTATELDAFIPLQYGDAIYVPRLEDRIAVLGEVREPGETIVPFGRRVTVLDAISRVAGGLTEGADRSSAMIIRPGEQIISVDLRLLLDEGDLTQNKLLYPGDVLVVREAGKISVLGEVGAPQSIQIAEPISVVEALARVGSTTPEADLRRAQVITPDGSIPIDLDALVMRGELQYNLAMNAGDVLLVPPAGPETVLVLGAVTRPGVINIREQQQRDVLRLLTAAGPTDMAALKSVHIYRENESITVDVEAIMAGDLSRNIALEPDDVVVVTEVNTVYLMGAATRQGPIPLTEELSVLDVVAGFANFQLGNMRQVTVLRTDDLGETEFFTLNMGQAHKGIAPEDMTLREGDIIFIPYRDRGFDWGEARNALWAIGSLWGLLGALF